MSYDGWPLASAPDGSARVLKGWVAVQVGKIETKAMCVSCGSSVKKIKGENARLCSKCGRLEWPDWENRAVDGRRWRLRFGIVHIVVSEFGYEKETGTPNSNYHFHTCFFGPYVEQTRLVEIFREESRRVLGVESRGVWIGKAKKGFRSVLAHALKYTAKVPATTPAGFAEYEKILVGVRRYAVRGFLQGVLLEQKCGGPNCPECKTTQLNRIPGLGLVPLSEIEDIPFLTAETFEAVGARKNGFESEETGSQMARAPC